MDAEIERDPTLRLTDVPCWHGVIASIDAHVAAALAEWQAAGAKDATARLDRQQADDLGRLVLTAVVAETLESHPLATLLALHAEAVARHLLRPVPAADELDPGATLLDARQTSSPALLAVEAGVYGTLGDLVRQRLRAAAA
ncbi:hypothetical protein AX769_18365 [Frondihabitans sp. PAMC 28766]|uniref:hypothetical protein n=1 Tax=Frondihabitans sp. PAMC 28766 TaxID=1795630 RepID=UPI00078D6EE0|nr:hypothetical protein [Frondihabitans sp. PAMC 28766]AMM21751.1 hypothetical protein AX769_18365 [Frondihabitans sp. PAMC 28766]